MLSLGVMEGVAGAAIGAEPAATVPSTGVDRAGRAAVKPVVVAGGVCSPLPVLSTVGAARTGAEEAGAWAVHTETPI